MSKSTKSPKALLKLAYEIGLEALEEYSHPKSPQIYTQAQLFACLVFKAFLQIDYRTTENMLNENSDYRKIVGIKQAPHFTTLQKAEQRLLNKESTRKLLTETIRQALTRTQLNRLLELTAVDGSGFESHHVSDYFVKRRASKNDREYKEMSYKKYPKLSVVSDCATHLILAAHPSRGPSHDLKEFPIVIKDAVKATDAKIKTLLADAAYDSEGVHAFLRETLNIESIIPPVRGRKPGVVPSGRYRRKLATRFPTKRYGQRWQVETVFSMIKRNLGHALTARRYMSQCRELNLKVLVHNIAIIRRIFR